MPTSLRHSITSLLSFLHVLNMSTHQFYAVAVASSDPDNCAFWVRWLFRAESVSSYFLAVLVFPFLLSFPETSSWLSLDDCVLAVRRMKQESSRSLRAVTVKITWDGANSTLKDGRLDLHYLLSMDSCIPPISLYFSCWKSSMGSDNRDGCTDNRHNHLCSLI